MAGDLEINELLWDGHVVAHIARHRVTAAEVEQVVFDPATEWEIQDRPPRARLVAVGPTSEQRILFVVCEMPSRSGTSVCVTARPVTAQEQQVYEQRRSDDDEG